MGCGASKAADVAVPNRSAAAVHNVEQNNSQLGARTARARSGTEALGTPLAEDVSRDTGLMPHADEAVKLVTTSALPGNISTETLEQRKPPISDSRHSKWAADTEDLDSASATSPMHSPASKPAPPAAVAGKGKIADRVSAIIGKDDDQFGGDDEVLAITQKTPHGGNTAALSPLERVSNPLSVYQPAPLGPIRVSGAAPQSSGRANVGTEQQFTTIGGSRVSALPGLPSVNGLAHPKGDWMVVGPLDQLGDEDDILTITPKAHTAQGRNEVVKLTRHDTYDAKDEEEDTFDPYAIAPPRFTELPAVRESRAYAVQGTESSDTPLEPADPWERLQSQYRIRPESGSPSTSKRSKATVASGALGPDDELILDEDARFTVAAPARGRAQDRRAPARAAVESAGPKVSKWGDGAMAQAGELMLGRGALDNDDGIVDQNSFSGGLYGDNSKFSADYVEYQGNDASLDMDALEVPKFNDNVVDMAMEDFNEDLETFGVKKDSKPSLEDKLRMFEEADHGDMDEDDLFLKEELRLLASSADALNL